jgi:hypothetical protein
MANELTSDFLGAAGEAMFARLCAQASLVCNKSDRDRTGWDFIVEFPMVEPSVEVILDERTPIACAVQLKSTARAGPVGLRLSAAERLAKDLRPTFIVVFRLTTSGEGIVGYLIHLLGSPLRKILQRLRTAHANESYDVNRATISFDYQRYGDRFPLTPDGLRHALLAASGDDREIYVAEKQRQLNELGYENGRLEAEAVVRFKSVEHLSDIALGLAPLRPERVRVFDTRFGIRLPYVGPAFEGIEELRIEPPSVGPCLVAIRGAGLSPAAIFDAEMLAGLPFDTDGGTWLLVRHADFTMKFGSDSVAFASTGSIETTLRRLSAWIPLVRGLVYLAGADGAITLTSSSVPDARVTLPMTSALEGPYVEQLPELLRLLVGWERLITMAGTLASEPFSLQDVWAARRAALAVELFGDQPPRASFAFNREDLGDPTDAVRAIYIDTAALGGAAISFGFKVTLEPSQDAPGEYRSTHFQPVDVRPAVPDLQDYAEDLVDEHGLKIIIHPANVIGLEAPKS